MEVQQDDILLRFPRYLCFSQLVREKLVLHSNRRLYWQPIDYFLCKNCFQHLWKYPYLWFKPRWSKYDDGNVVCDVWYTFYNRVCLMDLTRNRGFCMCFVIWGREGWTCKMY